jgi:hypothetical protein
MKKQDEINPNDLPQFFACVFQDIHFFDDGQIKIKYIRS